MEEFHFGGEYLHDTWWVAPAPLVGMQSEMVTNHEILHGTLNSFSAYGTVLVVYFALVDEEPDLYKETYLDLLGAAKNTHETYATFMSFPPGFSVEAVYRELPVAYHRYLDAALRLVDKVPPTLLGWLAVESYLTAVMCPPMIRAALQHGLGRFQLGDLPSAMQPDERLRRLMRCGSTLNDTMAFVVEHELGDQPETLNRLRGSDPAVIEEISDDVFDQCRILTYDVAARALRECGAPTLDFDEYRNDLPALMEQARQLLPRSGSRLRISDETGTVAFDDHRRRQTAMGRIRLRPQPRPVALLSKGEFDPSAAALGTPPNRQYTLLLGRQAGRIRKSYRLDEESNRKLPADNTALVLLVKLRTDPPSFAVFDDPEEWEELATSPAIRDADSSRCTNSDLLTWASVVSRTSPGWISTLISRAQTITIDVDADPFVFVEKFLDGRAISYVLTEWREPKDNTVVPAVVFKAAFLPDQLFLVFTTRVGRKNFQEFLRIRGAKPDDTVMTDYQATLTVVVTALLNDEFELGSWGRLD